MAGGGSGIGGGQTGDGDRLSWEAICQRADCKGRWVALDECKYDEASGRQTEGTVVDSDDDLAELCRRVRDAQYKNCAIFFCTERSDGTCEEDPFLHSAH